MKRMRPTGVFGAASARSFFVDSVLIEAALAVHSLPPSSGWIERQYSNGVYPAIDRIVRGFTNPLPFCVGDVALVVVLILLVGYYARAVRAARGRFALTAAHLVTRSVALICALYVWFMVSWAYGYARIPLAEKIPLHDARTDEDSVNRFADRVVDELSRSAPAAHREHLTDEEVALRLQPAFEATIRRLGDDATFSPPRIKPTVFQPLFAASGTTGFTDPWTHEVNLDASLFAFERPAIYAHEWSHISGFNDEAEANFIAVVACTTSHDPLLVYSGWLLVWGNLPQNVRLTHRMGRTAYDDIAAIRARYLKNVNPQVEGASRAAYDGYLKSNHVKAGFASYALFIRWMTGADFDRAGLPVVPSRRDVQRTGGTGT